MPSVKSSTKSDNKKKGSNGAAFYLCTLYILTSPTKNKQNKMTRIRQSDQGGVPKGTNGSNDNQGNHGNHGNHGNYSGVRGSDAIDQIVGRVARNEATEIRQVGTDGITQTTTRQRIIENETTTIPAPPSRGPSHTRTSEISSYISRVLAMSPSAAAARARFDAIVARTRVFPLVARRLRALLAAATTPGAAGLLTGPQRLAGTQRMLLRGQDMRLAAIALNDAAYQGTADVSPTKKQLCAMIMSMSNEEAVRASVELAEVAPLQFVAALREDQLSVVAPAIVSAISNGMADDADLRARILLCLWPKDAVYRGLWSWYHSDAPRLDEY